MDGVSFIVRVRNEEQTLETSLRSLKGLTIPHEIVVILHLCTDRSKEIAEELKKEFPIRIVEFSVQQSRAGYETMATDATSEHSIVYYCNWCISHAKYNWKFKWDADYISTPEFLEYFNNKLWTQPVQSTKIWFESKSEDGINTEPFLFSGNFHYTKYFFWEVLTEKDNAISINANVHVNTLSKLSNMKAYWKEPAWFFGNSDEARIVLDRWITLTRICGEEPLGQARALDPNNWVALGPAKSNEHILKVLGISYI